MAEDDLEKLMQSIPLPMLSPGEHKIRLFRGFTWQVSDEDGFERSMSMSSTGPDFDLAAAKRMDAMIHDAVDHQRVELSKHVHEPWGEVYYYLADAGEGHRICFNTEIPLEGIASWKEYEEKARAYRVERRQAIQEAIAAGRYRLVDVDVEVVHLCRDVKTGQMLEVKRIRLDDGRDVANINVAAGTPSGVFASMPWQEHLRAVLRGAREIVELKATSVYLYEVSLEGGGTVRHLSVGRKLGPGNGIAPREGGERRK